MAQQFNSPTGSGGSFGSGVGMSPSGTRIVVGDVSANYIASPATYYGGAFIFDRNTSYPEFFFNSELNTTVLPREGMYYYFTGFGGYNIGVTDEGLVVVGASLTDSTNGKLLVIDSLN